MRRTTGFRPKSVPQIGGAGAVGTGSLRGLPVLHQLHDDAVSALVMSESVDELSDLPAVEDRITDLEGEIWRPRREGESSGPKI